MALPLLAMGALPWVTFTIIACKCCREHALRANSRFVCRVLAAQILLFQGSQPPIIKKTAQNYWSGHSHSVTVTVGSPNRSFWGPDPFSEPIFVSNSQPRQHFRGQPDIGREKIQTYVFVTWHRRLTCAYNHQSHHLLLGGAAAVGSAHACA